MAADVYQLLERLAEQQAAISDAQRALHRLAELGLADDAAQGAIQPRQRPLAHSGTRVAHEGAAPAGRQRAATMVAKNCERCGAGYQVDARGAHRSKFCEACRVEKRRASNKRTAEARRAERDRAEAAAICEQTAAEGYQPLTWSNGRGAS